MPADNGSFQESFFLLTQSVKFELLNAVRFGHARALEGETADKAVSAYMKTRAIFTECEEGT